MPQPTPDPADTALTFGQRLKIQRTRRGMTRDVLAGLVGKSASWVKALENGRLHTPKLANLLRLAEALRVRDLAQLTGDQSMPISLFTGPGHPRLSQVRAAINAPPALSPREAPRSCTCVHALTRHGRHATPHHTIGRCWGNCCPH